MQFELENREEATLECVTTSEEGCSIACHTDCGPFWNDD